MHKARASTARPSYALFPLPNRRTRPTHQKALTSTYLGALCSHIPMGFDSEAIFCAISTALSTSWSSGNTRDTRPHRSATSAVIGSPVRIIYKKKIALVWFVRLLYTWGKTHHTITHKMLGHLHGMRLANSARQTLLVANVQAHNHTRTHILAQAHTRTHTQCTRTSMARDLPMARVRRCEPPKPGMVPILTSG